MNPENVLPTGDGLTEIGTVTGGETDNYIELSATGGWGWRDENGDLMNSIDSVKIACNLEDYNNWMSLLMACKPLEASEIPSLMEAFPEGETTELKVWPIEDGTFEVPNELIHQTILTCSRHSLFFNSYGIAAMTPKELYQMVAEDSGFEPAWRVILNEDGSIDCVDTFCFNDTDGDCAYVAGLGFANFFNIKKSNQLVDDAEGIWKRFGPEDIGSPMETLHCPTEGEFVEPNSNGYLVLRTKDYFDDIEDDSEDDIGDVDFDDKLAEIDRSTSLDWEILEDAIKFECFEEAVNLIYEIVDHLNDDNDFIIIRILKSWGINIEDVESWDSVESDYGITEDDFDVELHDFVMEELINNGLTEGLCDACGQSKNEDHCDGNLYEVGYSMKVCSECYFEGRDEDC